MSPRAKRSALDASVPEDGRVDLRWPAPRTGSSFALLIIRTGAKPAYTVLRLGGETTSYQIQHLSRHQRYRLCVLDVGRRSMRPSPWLSITPKAGLAPVLEAEEQLEHNLARIGRFYAMPQDQRITAFWELGPGFVDGVTLEVWQGKRRLRTFDLEPEVGSLAVDTACDLPLKNGQEYRLRISTRFLEHRAPLLPEIRCAPAPPGQEREANRGFLQAPLLYPFLSPGDEIQIFDETQESQTFVAPHPEIVCGRCGTEIEWRSYLLRCPSCGADYVPNGHGDYLEESLLRFGTCRCCAPKKILICKKGGSALTCAHSGKEHIRLPGEPGHLLIEELPFGLCQCCRPRRPLVRQQEGIRCQQSRESHRLEQGRYVLIPSQPVFDAAAIDELLDAGLAEICASGVTSSRPPRRNR